ncbi:MAG: transcription-repair coupling factor, partial [Phycisphaeraceae bacterium]|nr:transcription-repair coupling factor [Phycisphaeraceae bacterium]
LGIAPGTSYSLSLSEGEGKGEGAAPGGSPPPFSGRTEGPLPPSPQVPSLPTPANRQSAIANRQSPPSLALCLVPHHELFHRYGTRRRIRRISAGTERASDAFLDLEVGDYVVHVDHGIARFVGLRTMRRNQATEDYLTLEFAGKALLHVPATQMDLIQKYVGGFGGRPPLSMLGGKRWARQKEQVAEAVKDLAAQMLRIQAARSSLPGVRYPADTAWQKEFEAEFPYEETEDQLAAIAEIKKDMADEQPMDRLICGDVGFGKTEVAIRAAFKAVEYGKQVAVLVPTTVLAEQHERTFAERMADYPFRVASLSRFKTGSEQNAVLGELSQGKVDVVIGTHRLLSEDVKFADLGLVIIDEEQRFGVEHKQKLLKFRLTADVLTLTATPIPRTLHMSMLGLRDISSLSTAPLDRRAIVTEVIPFDQRRIQQALLRELNREGQVYFVHNRVHNIQSVADMVQKLVPQARIAIGHGQMAGHELEAVMLRFMRRQVDILVCTTIIESGIDIATANTMFINEADHFGLADLHQLRGRVGRWKHRAYCYLLLPDDRPITDTAQRRLKAIEQFSMLGAGFKIAMRDLEIRGAGNLLGAEQSGHIAAVGYEMYCKLLEQEARKLRQETVVEPVKTHIELGIVGRITPQYIPSDKYRMDAYRRLSRAAAVQELELVRHDMVDAYGPAPALVQTLLDLTELRILASLAGIKGIQLDGQDVIFRVDPPPGSPLAPGSSYSLSLSEGEGKGEGAAPGCSPSPFSGRTEGPLPPSPQDPSLATPANRQSAIDNRPSPTAHVVALFRQARGRVTVLDEKTVYYRPPDQYLKPVETLLAVLRKVLRG